MPEFEDGIGLKESQRGEFNTFAKELSPYFEQLQRIGLKILIWGPGEGTHFYHKREEVKQCLSLANENDEVATSEDLIRNIEHPSQFDVVQAEMLHAHVADLIFGLVTSDPQQTGIYMEVDNLLRYDSLTDKTWLIVPDRHDWKKVGAFIQQPLLQSFPTYRRKEFRMKVLEQCEELRRFCLDRVGEERQRKMRKHIHEVLSGR